MTARIRRWHALLLAVFATGLLVSCHAGYPTEDALSGRQMNSSDNVRLLNALSQDVPRPVRHDIALIGDCTLRFTSRVPRQFRPSFDVSLLTLQTETRVDPGSRLTLIEIGVPDETELSTAKMRAVYETNRWDEAAIFRTTLDRLQGLCAKSLRTRKSAAPGSAWLPSLPGAASSHAPG